MRSSSVGPALVVVASVALFAGEISAQENTPTACADRVDNDADGFVDCLDQDCSYMTFCSSGGPQSYGSVGRAGEGRGLIVSGTVISSIGLAAGVAALGLATQSTRDDAFLFSSIGVGSLGWLMSVIGGGLHIGGQARNWRTLRAAGTSPRTGLGITSVVLYGVMVVGVSVLCVMGPTLGPATGVGSAPFWGPALALEMISFGVLLPAGIISMRRAAASGRGASMLAIMPYFSRSPESGATSIGLTGVF